MMDRDFDVEEIIDKMKALGDRRDLEILEEQGKISEEKVLNVKYLGKIDTIGDIYLLIEQRKDKNGNLIQIERYETENGEVIAGNNKADSFDFIVLSEKFKDKSEVLEQLNELDKDSVLDLNEIEQGRLEKIAKALGLEVKDLKKVARTEANKKVKIKDEEEEKGETEENGENAKKTLSKNELEKTTTKTAVSPNQKVTDKETVASLLKVEEKGYKSINIVESDKLQEDRNTTRFSFVGIREVEKEDGTKEEVAEKIDTLEQVYGNNPTKEVNSLNRDGGKIEKEIVNSTFAIKGDNENQVAVDIGEMGRIEFSYLRTPRQNNGKAISIPIETDSIKPTTREVREFMNKQKNPDVKQEIKRLEEHQEAGCEEVTIRDINDDIKDDTHTHIQIDEKWLDEIASEILKNNEEIANVYNRQDVKARVRKYIEEREKMPETEELKKEIEVDMEKEAESEHEQPRIQKVRGKNS